MGILYALAACALTYAMIWKESKWQKSVLERLDGIKEELEKAREERAELEMIADESHERILRVMRRLHAECTSGKHQTSLQTPSSTPTNTQHL